MHGQASRVLNLGSWVKVRMKYQCIKTCSCSICGQKGTIQAFLNSDNLVKYARTRHYKQGIFTYCKLENLREIEEQLKSQMRLDQEQNGQENSRSSNLPSSSYNYKIVAGGEGFEPSTPNLGGWCSLRDESFSPSTSPFASARDPPIRAELLAHSNETTTQSQHRYKNPSKNRRG